MLLASEYGVRRFVVAGGETSGAVTAALGVTAVRIGPNICPGVPWTESLQERPLALALKSGNFGDRQFFTQALEMLLEAGADPTLQGCWHGGLNGTPLDFARFKNRHKLIKILEDYQ